MTAPVTLTRDQQRQVRDLLGHGRGDRVVTIHLDGTVTYRGALSGFDYDKHRVRLFGGYADELLLEAQALDDMYKRQPRCHLVNGGNKYMGEEIRARLAQLERAARKLRKVCEWSDCEIKPTDSTVDLWLEELGEALREVEDLRGLELV